MTVVVPIVCQLLFEAAATSRSIAAICARSLGLRGALAWYAMLCAATTWLKRAVRRGARLRVAGRDLRRSSHSSIRPTQHGPRSSCTTSRGRSRGSIRSPTSRLRSTAMTSRRQAYAGRDLLRPRLRLEMLRLLVYGGAGRLAVAARGGLDNRGNLRNELHLSLGAWRLRFVLALEGRRNDRRPSARPKRIVAAASALRVRAAKTEHLRNARRGAVID